MQDTAADGSVAELFQEQVNEQTELKTGLTRGWGGRGREETREQERSWQGRERFWEPGWADEANAGQVWRLNQAVEGAGTREGKCANWKDTTKKKKNPEQHMKKRQQWQGHDKAGVQAGD